MCHFCLQFQIRILLLFSIGFTPIKGGGNDQLNTQQAKENLRVKFSLLFSLKFWNSLLLPKGEFSSFKNLSHKVLWSCRWCGSLLEVFCFRHCWFTTTECEGQANKRRTKFQNQSKLFELSLILKAIHGMNWWMQIFLELFRLVYDAWTLGKPNNLLKSNGCEIFLC